MKPLQFLIQPWRKSAAARVDVRVGDCPSPEGYGVGGYDWEPAVTSRPTLSLELMPLELDGKTQVGKAHFALQLGSIKNVSDAPTLDYQGAPLTIWSTDDLGWDRRVVEFAGNIMTARYDTENGTLTVDAEASTILIERPLLTLSFSGAGALNGEANKRGILRPAGFGTVFYVEPVWFDETYNIGQLDGYGNLLSIQKAMEGADDRTSGFVADYANYAALKAAIIAKTIPAGRWGSSIADGIVGLGAPPLQGVPWGFNCTFGYGKPGSLMQRIIQFHAGVPIGQIDTVSFAAITAQVEAVLGTTADVGYWTKDQRQVIDLLQAVAGSVNAAPLVTLQGIFTVSRGVTSAPVQTLNRSGSVDPRVINWKSADSRSPYYQLKARTARPARVLNRDEVLYTDTLVDMGVWAAGTGYRIGNTVYGSDGAQFLYTNGTPTVGPALPTSTYPPAAMATNAYWQQITRPPATTGSMIGVADGATADLKLTSIGTQSVTIAGNVVTRNAGAGDFAPCVRGGAIQGPQFVEVDILAGGWTIFGLDDDATNWNPALISLQIQFDQTSGNWYAFTNSSPIISGTIGAGVTGKLRLSYDGIRYRIYANATQLGADIQASASNLILWPKWTIYAAAAYTGLRAGPYTANIWPDIGGPGTPANNATAPFLLIPLDGNVRVTGNELLAVTSTSSSAYISYPATGSAEFSWKADASSNHNFICGFVIAANVASTTGSSLAYGLEASGGNLYVWAAGTQTLLSISTAGDRYKITYDGVNFRAYKNGVEIAAAAKPAVAAATYYGRLGLGGTAGVKLTEVASASFTQNNFSDIGGTTRPADNAATSGVLTTMGAGSVLVGNSMSKSGGGTHGGQDGGAVGQALYGSAYVTSSIIGATVTGGWETRLGLDNDATAFALANMDFGLRIVSADNGVIGHYAWELYTSNSLRASGAASGITATSRASLVYDGVNIYAVVDGAIKGQYPAAAGLTLYPKVLDFYWTGLPGYAAGYTDILYGPWSENAWSRIGGTGKPSDNATSDLQLTSIGSSAVTIVGNTIVRAAGANDYTACVIGTPTLGQAYAEALVPSGGYAMVSLDDDATSTAFASMNIIAYCANTDLVVTVGNATVYAGNPGTVAGQKLAVSYDGVRFRVYLNGTQIGSDQVTSPGLRLWPKWHSFTAAVTVTGLRQQVNNSNLWGDIGGANVPAPNAGTVVTLETYGTGMTLGPGNGGTKSGGSSAWGSGFRSAAPIAGAQWVEARPGNGGLSLNLSADGSVTGVSSTSGASLYWNGATCYWDTTVDVPHTLTGGTATSLYRITYDGVNYRYYIDGVLKMTKAASGAGLSHKPGVDFFSPGWAAQDFRCGPFTDNDWASVGGPNKPADNATADVVLTSIGSQAVTILGNSFSRNAGGGDFTAMVRGVPTTGAQFVEMDIQPTASIWSIFTIDDDATSFTQAAQLFYLQFQSSSGSWSVLSNGSVLYTGTLATGITGKLRISYDGVSFRAFVNQTQVGSAVAAGSSSLSLWPKWYAYSGSAAFYTGMRAGPFTDNSWTSIPNGPANVFALGGTEDIRNNLLAMAADTGGSSGRARVFLQSNGSTLGGSVYTLPDMTQNIAQQWDDVLGTKKPADNAATSGFLIPIGSYSNVRGNQVWKNGGGTHGAFQGGVVGLAQQGSMFISSSINYGTVGGGWITVIALDDDATTYNAPGNMSLYAQITATGSGNYNWYLAGTSVAGISGTGTGLTVNSRFMLAYDGVNAFIMVDGIVKGQQQAGSMPWLYPKLLDFYVNGSTVPVTDILYGPFSQATGDVLFRTGSTSVRSHVFRGSTIINVGGTGSWDAFASSRQGMVGSASLRFLIGIYGMVGLTTTPDGYAPAPTVSQYGGLNYAVFNTGNTGWILYESGAVAESLGTSKAGVTFSPNTAWRIDYDGTNVRYYADGVLMHTTAAAANLVLYAATTMVADAQMVSGVVLAPFADRWLDNQVDGTNYARLPVATSTGSGTSRRALIDFTQGHSNKNLDNVGDGSTYARVAGAELTSGVPKVTIAGSGKKVGDARNLPNVSSMNLSYKFTGAITYTSAAGTPATGTISVAAGATVAGVTVSYSAMSVGVSGTGGTIVTYYLYVNDPTNAGGAQTLVATTTALDVYQGNNYIYIGSVDVSYPTSGTGGGGGAGGGGTCPLADAWVHTSRGFVQARHVVPGVDWILCEADDRVGMEWVLCESNELSREYGGRVVAANGFEVTVSSSTPILPRGAASLMPVTALDGHELAVPVGSAFEWHPCVYIPCPQMIEVAKLKVQNRIYAAGDIAGRSIMTHNPNPKP